MPTIGAALIVKNEKEVLARCLESVKGVDDIFIADTGSVDNTVEIAKKFTPNVYTDFKWNDSFCDARNFIRKKATTDWILSIDADEYLHDFAAVKEAIAIAESKNAPAINVRMIAEDNGQYFMYPRLFKNTPSAFWVGNIHNHLSVLGIDEGNVRITHTYSPAHNLDPDRAYRILKKDVAKNGGPREMFYLGREYYYRGEFEEAVKMLGQYVQLSRYLAEKADAFLIMGKSYWKMGMPDDARDACAQALIINANFKEALLFMAEMSWEHNAEQWRRLAETANNRDVLFTRNV